MHAIQIREMPSAVYEKLKETSKKNHRSLSGEALHILESTLLGGGYPASREELFDTISSVRETIAREYGTGSGAAPLVREDRDR